MITGLILKKRLHLQNFSNLRIRRINTGGGIRTYQIVFNSRIPDLPLTTYMLNMKKLMPHITDGYGKSYSGTPWADLHIFNGQLNGAIFFVSDLAGFYGIESNYSEKYIKISENRLVEITIPDLKKVDVYTSTLTQTYKDLRKQYQGQGIKNTKLVDSKLIKESGSIQYIFLTESTEITGKDKASHRVGSDSKQQFSLNTDSLVPNLSKTYDMVLQLDNIFPNSENTMSWLQVYDGELIDRKMMKELLDVADVRIWDNTPAFQYQGFRYRLSQIKASLYPEIRPDNFWVIKHGSQAYLDKHFSQLFDKGTLDLFLNNMLSILIKYCKQLGYAELQKGQGNYKINTGDKNAR